MSTATVRHTRRPPAKTAKAQAAPTGTPKPTRAPSTPKKAPKPAKPPTAKAASSRPSRAPTKKPVRRSNTKAATASKPPVKAAKPPAKPTRFWRALGLSAAGVAAAAGLYAAYRKRGTLMAAVQPVLQRMTPAEKARFVKECNAKGVKGKTANGVVKGVDKGRGKAGYVSAVVVAVVALVGVGAYVWRRTNLQGSYHETLEYSPSDEEQQLKAFFARQASERIEVDLMKKYIDSCSNGHRPTFMGYLEYQQKKKERNNEWRETDYETYTSDLPRSYHNLYSFWAKACTKSDTDIRFGDVPKNRKEDVQEWLKKYRC